MADKTANDWTIESDETSDDVWKDPFATDTGDSSPLPFLDPGIEAELEADGPPAWLGKRWREIEEPGEKAEAWTKLRGWTDWFIREYRLGVTIVPTCWFEHSDVVAELYGAMCAEYKIWEEGAPGLGPMTTWNMHVGIMSGRLQAMVKSTECLREKKHVPDIGYGELPAFVLDYDQSRWAAVRDGLLDTTTVPRDDKNVTWWRPIGTNSEGEIFTGESIPIGAARPATPLSITGITVSSAAANSVVEVECHISGTDIAELSWESSIDQKTWTPYQESE